jgi:hypothetical protein
MHRCVGAALVLGSSMGLLIFLSEIHSHLGFSGGTCTGCSAEAHLKAPANFPSPFCSSVILPSSNTNKHFSPF